MRKPGNLKSKRPTKNQSWEAELKMINSLMSNGAVSGVEAYSLALRLERRVVRLQRRTA